MSKAPPKASVDQPTELDDSELDHLCEATEAAIVDGGGFGWLKPPHRPRLETYWRGVLLVPERSLFIARLGGIVVGSVQLVHTPRNNEAQRGVAYLQHLFVAPWARRRGLARMLVRATERQARQEGCRVLNLDVRDTQVPAVTLFESLEYVRWGTHPYYAWVNGHYVPGLFFCKLLNLPKPPPDE
ncbi:MAG: GNAT family N-acetyltransferase [Alphaproteobacteria bacterium]|nr:GNAT family N-acetyltransferase [Alphaproteobacteria bacterium]